MTGSGEEFHDDSDPRPVPGHPGQAETFSGLSPLGSVEDLRNSQRQMEGTGPNSKANRSAEDEELNCSIFDDDDDDSSSLLGDLPDAIPNVSDGGTDILKTGRPELREFHERFLNQIAPQNANEEQANTDTQAGEF